MSVSNRRHSVWKTDALPTELMPLKLVPRARLKRAISRLQGGRIVIYACVAKLDAALLLKLAARADLGLTEGLDRRFRYCIHQHGRRLAADTGDARRCFRCLDGHQSPPVLVRPIKAGR